MRTCRRWLACIVAGGCLLAAGCGGARASQTAPAPSATAAAAASSTTSPGPVARSSVLHSPTPARPRPRRHQPDPGSLPQTTQLPSADTRAFKAEMSALWRAIRDGALGPGRSAFFPGRAYVQIKAIADAESDYRDRLLGDYSLDIGAAHALLGGQAHDAQLIGVHVPQGYAHWVSAGACYNRVGYYEVPNSRVVYREGGDVRSFGIASMISWRGVWYVVHLGAITRQSSGGEIDDPSAGAGESVPSSTC